MGTLLNSTTLSNGWTVEEWDSSSRVNVCEAVVPEGVLARFYARLTRFPRARIVRVYYWQGSTTEDRARASRFAIRSTTRDWSKCTTKWWKKRNNSGSYRFYTNIGIPINVEETFAELVLQLDVPVREGVL